MERRIRLGISEQSSTTGGRSRYVGAILKGLDPAEFDVTVFGDRGGPYSASDVSRLVPLPGSAPLGPVDPASGLPPLQSWAGFGRRCRKVGRIFRWRRVDLLHTVDADAEGVGLAARLAGVPRVVGTLRLDGSHRAPGPGGDLGRRLLDRLGGFCLDRAIAPTDAAGLVASRRGRIARGRIETIRKGVDLGAFRRLRAPAEARAALGLAGIEGPVVGAVGRLEASKGVADLIDAAAWLGGTLPGLALVIVGEGSLRPDLEARALRLGIAARVHFLGHRADVATAYEAFDAYALPSIADDLPASLLEAMACSLPCIGTRVGGVPEAILDGVTGFLVPPADPRSLALAIRRVLEPGGRAEALGRAARGRVEGHFDEAEMVRRTVAVYRDLIARSPRLTAPDPGRSA